MLHFQNSDGTVGWHTTLPEIRGILIQMVQDSPQCTTVGCDENGFVLKDFVPNQFLIKSFSPLAYLPYILSARRSLKGERIGIKLLKPFFSSGFCNFFRCQAVPVSPGNLPDSGILDTGNIRISRYDLRGLPCTLIRTRNHQVKRDRSHILTGNLRKPSSIFIQ